MLEPPDSPGDFGSFWLVAYADRRLRMEPSIAVNHLCKSFGPLRAVEDVSFEVYPGEILGLLGPNGAGQRTTIRMLLDIFRPDGGETAILGGKPVELGARRPGAAALGDNVAERVGERGPAFGQRSRGDGVR